MYPKHSNPKMSIQTKSLDPIYPQDHFIVIPLPWSHQHLIQSSEAIMAVLMILNHIGGYWRPKGTGGLGEETIWGCFMVMGSEMEQEVQKEDIYMSCFV